MGSFSLLSHFRIIAIDPGYDRCGVAVVDKNSDGSISYVYSTCIETTKKDSFSSRLAHLRGGLLTILSTYQPTTAVLEKLFFSKNTQTALKVAEAVGVIRVTLEEFGLSPHEYTPVQIKVATTGYGGADKEAVFSMTKRLLRIPEGTKLDDEIDAIAVAIAHAYTYKG